MGNNRLEVLNTDDYVELFLHGEFVKFQCVYSNCGM
jgi:hypothetical protein